MPAPADTTTAAAAAPAAAKPYSGPVDAEGKPLRMCCACPDTKSIRVRHSRSLTLWRLTLLNCSDTLFGNNLLLYGV